MKKLGKKLTITSETMKAYCGCACTTVCSAKCTSCSSTVAMTSLNNTNVSNIYSTTGVTAKS